MQVSILYSFKTRSNTLCRGTVCFLARQAPAACQSSLSPLLVARRKQTRFSFLLPFNRSLFHVWKLKTRVFQCGAWMCVCPLAHLFLISWLESISHQKEQKNNFSLTCCSEALALHKAFLLFAILGPVEEHYKMQSTLWMGCSAYIVLGSFSPLVVVISSIRNLLEKSLCWGKTPVICSLVSWVELKWKIQVCSKLRS